MEKFLLFITIFSSLHVIKNKFSSYFYRNNISAIRGISSKFRFSSKWSRIYGTSWFLFPCHSVKGVQFKVWHWILRLQWSFMNNDRVEFLYYFLTEQRKHQSRLKTIKNKRQWLKKNKKNYLNKFEMTKKNKDKWKEKS